MKAFAVMLLTLLMLLAAGAELANFSTANFFPDPGPDLPRIYIRQDGSVEPATAPIERTGNVYKLTDNIAFYTVEIQRDNIVLDGAGYTIQGNASRIKGHDEGNNGLIVSGRKDVTVTGLNFERGDTGIRILSSSYITVIDNSFTNGVNTGIALQDSTLVLIETNNFTDLHTDINVPAVMLNGSKNTFRNNTLTGGAYGIDIKGSSNVISDNKIEITYLPIKLDKANFNTIADNKISGQGGEGIALFADCSNNLIFGNNITGFGHAIRIMTGSNNTVYGNYMANNQFAIDLSGWDTDLPENNTFYGNTFAADSCKVRLKDAGGNFWDNGTIGNYWGDYNGTDSNGDGIGEASYTILGYKWDNDVHGDVSFVAGQDNYPLMEPYDIEHEAVVLPQTYPFLVVLAAVAIAVVVGAGLLVYYKKHKRYPT